MTVDPWETLQRLVAVLTAVHHRDIETATAILAELDRKTLSALVVQACGTLNTYITESADDEMSVEDYLAVIGLAAANGAST